MRSNFIALGLCLLAACGTDDGEPIPGCQTDCGPGALRSGRIFPGYAGAAASPSGKVARIDGDEIVWLNDDFTMSSTTKIDLVDEADSGTTGALTISDGGRAFLRFESYARISDVDERWRSLVVVAPDHTQTWRYDFGEFTEPNITGDDGLALITGDRFDIGSTRMTPKTLLAVRPEDGTFAWRKDISEIHKVAKVAGGNVIVAGSFSSTFDFGGACGSQTATSTSDTFIAAYAPLHGECLWVVPIIGETSISQLAVDAAGDVALDISFYQTSMTIGGQTIAPTEDFNHALAVLDPAGHVRWTKKLDRTASSLLTDGEHVIVTDLSYIAQVSATGIDWEREVAGNGSHLLRGLALTNDRLIVQIQASEYQDQAVTTIGDVTIAGVGLILADVVR